MSGTSPGCSPRSGVKDLTNSDQSGGNAARPEQIRSLHIIHLNLALQMVSLSWVLKKPCFKWLQNGDLFRSPAEATGEGGTPRFHGAFGKGIEVSSQAPNRRQLLESSRWELGSVGLKTLPCSLICARLQGQAAPRNCT